LTDRIDLPPRVILGIDASLRHTGLVVIDMKNRKVLVSETVRLEYIRKGKKLTPKQCFAKIAGNIFELAREYSHILTHVAIEDIFMNPNQRSGAMSLFASHGIGIGVSAITLGIDSDEIDERLTIIPPKSIKKIVSGSGNADKHGVEVGVLAWLKKRGFTGIDLLTSRGDNDEFDACATAISSLYYKQGEK